MTRKNTMTDLVTELEELEQTPAIQTMIEEAKAGEYHDFKNKKYICGKVALVQLLGDAGLDALRMRVMDGEFDEEADADDIADLDAWVKSAGIPSFK